MRFFLADVEVYYWIGTWNSSIARFTPDQPAPQLMDFGDFKFTGPSGFVDPVTGRNIMFTIAQGERLSQEESDAGWAHNAGLPVELNLRSDGRLGIKPIDELQSLRGQQLVNITSDTSFAAANSVLSAVTGDTLEIEMELARGTADRVGMKVRKSPNSEEETLLYYAYSAKEFGVDRTKTVAGTNKGIQKGTVDIGSENVKLHIYLDKSMVEAYLNGQKSITTRTYSTRDDAKGLQLWGDANASSIVVKSLKVWSMNSAYTQVPATGLSLSPASTQLLVGGKKTVYGTVAPADASNKNLIWTSSNPSIATVVNGVVTGQAVGSAIITAKTRDGAKTATTAVTVIAAPPSMNLTNGGFESGDLSGWIVESGNAFTNAAVTNQTAKDSQPLNQAGSYHLVGYLNGDAATGVLKSKTFVLGGNGQISFLIGGGSDIDNLYVSFVRASDGKELFRTTGPGTYWNWQSNKGETDSYTRRAWDATAYIGTSMYVKVVDERTDGWGHINIDDFIVPVQAGSADTQAPTPPTNLILSAKTSISVTLSWDLSSDNVGVEGYSIFRNGTKVGTSITTGYTDNGLSPNTVYTYTVKAGDSAGNLSAASNSVSVTTDSAASSGGISNHDFESGNLTGWTVVSGNAFSSADVTSDVNWGWGGPFNQNDSYHLWGFKDGGDSQVGVLKSETFTLGGNGAIDFLIGGGNDLNNLYVALVRASDGAELMKATGSNNEAYSRIQWNAASYVGTQCYIKIVDNATGGFGHVNVDDVNAPTSSSAVDSVSPTVPGSLTSPSHTDTSISLVWSASSDNVGVTGYRIYRNGIEVGSTATTSFIDTGLTADTSYTYTVKAVDAANNMSGFSGSLLVKTGKLSELTNHDFESGNLSGWTVESGNAFSAADVTSDVNWGWGGPFNQNGSYHLWGFKDGGDSQVGVLKSETFTLGGTGAINFLIGGGNDSNNLYVALVRASDGVELMKATGSNNEAYSRIQWNAASYVGTQCYIKIVDNAAGGFGHVNVDDVNVPVIVN